MIVTETHLLKNYLMNVFGEGSDMNWKFWKKSEPELEQENTSEECNCDECCEAGEASDECTVVLSLKDGNVSVIVDWEENADVSMIGALVGVIATGELFPTVLNEVEREFSERDMNDKLEELHAIIDHRMDAFGQQKDHERRAYRPAVEPLDAIRHQMTMYQNGGNSE
jgi:hypothetical protein